MLSVDELKELSKLVFLELIGKVTGRVFTKAYPDEDAIYINIKKGSLNFECRIFDISSYIKNYGKINFDDMTSAIVRKVLTYYRINILDKYLKNQPTLSLHVTKEPFRIDDVKEDSNDDIPRTVSAGTNCSESI